MFLRLVLACRTSLRCAGRVPAVVSEVCGLSLGQPHWTTGRLWLLRLGLYKLVRPKEIAEDWVWLLDHSIQAGRTKCLLILGIRLSALPPAGQPLRHEDLEAIELLPVEHSSPEIVCQQLEAATAKTGVPRAILDDHGSDLHGGVKLFQARHPATLEIHDITHKAACLLKRRLERDTRQSGAALREMLDALYLNQPARTLAIELAAFVRDQTAGVSAGERLPGTTEVLESCFGKLKALEQHQSRSGFTGLILSLGALVSQTTAEVVAQAMETIRTKDVWTWVRNVLGASIQSLRNQAYAFPVPTGETKVG